MRWRDRNIVHFTSLTLGLTYGLFARLMFGDVLPGAAGVFAAVSIAFVFVVPFAIGFIAVDEHARTRRLTVPIWIFRPWLDCFLLAAAFAILAWEGAICVVIMAPVYLAMGSLGGIVAGIRAARRRDQNLPASRTGLMAVALLPFAFSPVEHAFAPQRQQREVHTRIHIRAPAATVFREVAEVRSIAEHERTPSFFQWIGIPRPSEATLSYPGVGAIRDARFVEGLRFRETITRYEPDRSLGFTIAIDPKSVDPRVLDEHVTVGGPYFDVEYGEFRIEPTADGGVILLLMSRHTLATRFNAYAGLWSDAIMADLQHGICLVIKQRSEQAGRSRN